MKKLIFGLAVTSLTWNAAMGTDNNHNKSIYISGKITTNTDSLRLIVGVWQHYITGIGKEYRMQYIPVSGDGRFQVQLPAPDQPFRLQLADGLSSNVLFDNNQIAEPGDSIYVSATVRDQEEFSEQNFTGAFSGRGAAKYNCIQALKQISDEPLRSSQISTQERLHIYDSLRVAKGAVLQSFQPSLSQDIYQIIQADILGNLQYTFLVVEAATGKQQTLGGHGASTAFAAPDITNQNLALSVGYTNFLYAKTKQELLASDEKPGLGKLYQKIKTEYAGMLREKLLACCLLNDLDMTAGFNEDTEVYTRCLEDAVALIQTPWIKAPVETLLKTRGKGATAFNFSLPVDSSGKTLSLSDLKGKVVLLDCWSYICTGCYRFAGAFHEKVYPLLRNHPDFQVVSVMLDRFSGKEKYQERLRGENGPKYTFPQYINLYGGKGETTARDMEEHYNIQSYPFILLIDKRGKIYSSTIPFIDSPDAPNVDKLIALIKKALAES